MHRSPLSSTRHGMSATGPLPWLTVLAVQAVGCMGGLELTDPPNLRPLSDAYDMPTASLDMLDPEEIGASYGQRRLLYERLGGLGATVRALEGFDDAVEADGESGVRLQRVPLQANAEVSLRGACGNDADENGRWGTFELRAYVEGGILKPSASGTVTHCSVTRDIAGVTTTTRFDGEAAFFMPSLSKLSDFKRRAVIVRYALQRLEVQGVDVGPAAGDFGVEAGTVSFLIDLGDSGTVRVDRDADGFVTLHGRGSQQRDCGAGGADCWMRE